MAEKRHSGGVGGVAFSSDGAVLATVSREGVLLLWDTASWERILRLEGLAEGITELAFSPDGSLLAAGSRDGILRLLRPRDGKQLAELAGHRAGVRDLAFSPDGQWLASLAWDSELRLWDLGTRTPVAIRRASEGSGAGLEFSPDGRLLAWGAPDRTVAMWRVSELSRFRGVGAEVVEEAERSLLLALDDELELVPRCSEPCLDLSSIEDFDGPDRSAPMRPMTNPLPAASFRPDAAGF